jgi:hypothetical protein
MGWKKLIFGDKMPDKDDPRYRIQRESGVKAGREVAKALGVDKAAAKAQRVALKYPKTFLIVVFGFVVICLGYNVYRMVYIYNPPGAPRTAVERQDALFKLKRKHVNQSEDAIYQQQVKLLKDEIDVLTGKGISMTHDDSLKVKILLKQLLRMNNLKQENHDNRQN